MTDRLHHAKALGTLFAAVKVVGCGGTAEAPSAGQFEGFIPDLRGRRVMVFPVQLRAGVTADVDPEIVFALRTRRPTSDWSRRR